MTPRSDHAAQLARLRAALPAGREAAAVGLPGGLRVHERSEIDHAVRLQNDDISEIGLGSLESGGQLVLTLKPSGQGATKADVAELTDQLRRIESLLSAPR
jgi:hypothetical protein